MASNAILQRQELHSMIDNLPDERLSFAQGALETATQTFSEHMASLPYDDEGELSDLALESIRKSREEYAQGKFVSHDEVLREFGL